MRRIKSGKPHAHSKNIEEQGVYTIQARELLGSTLRTCLTMLDIWGGAWAGTPEESRLREAIGQYLALLKGES